MTTAAAPPQAATRIRPRSSAVGGVPSPAPCPWRLDLLGPDGRTAHVDVPDTTLDTWDHVEALVSSALDGARWLPAGRTPRGHGRPLEVLR